MSVQDSIAQSKVMFHAFWFVAMSRLKAENLISFAVLLLYTNQEFKVQIFLHLFSLFCKGKGGERKVDKIQSAQ